MANQGNDPHMGVVHTPLVIPAPETPNTADDIERRMEILANRMYYLIPHIAEGDIDIAVYLFDKLQAHPEPRYDGNVEEFRDALKGFEKVQGQLATNEVWLRARLEGYRLTMWKEFHCAHLEMKLLDSVREVRILSRGKR